MKQRDAGAGDRARDQRQNSQEREAPALPFASPPFNSEIIR